MASPTSSNTDPVVEKFKTLLNSNVPGIGKAVEIFIQLPFASEKERQETFEELSTFQPFYVVRLAQVFEGMLSSVTTKPGEILKVIKICNETCLKAGLGSKMDFPMFTECLAIVFEAVKSDPLACTASFSFSSLLKPLVNIYFSLQKANVSLPQTSDGIHFGTPTSNLVHPFQVVLQGLKPRLLKSNFHELVAETEAVIWCDGAVGRGSGVFAHPERFRGNILEKWLQLLSLPFVTNDFAIFLVRSDPIVYPAFLIDSLIQCSSGDALYGGVFRRSLITAMQKAMFELQNIGLVITASKPRMNAFFEHFSCLYQFPHVSLILLCNPTLSNNDLSNIMSLAPLLSVRKGNAFDDRKVRGHHISLTDLVPQDFYPRSHGNYDVERCFLRMCGLVNSVPDIWPAFKEIFEFWRRSFYQTEPAERCFGILDAAVEVVAVIVQVIGRDEAESNVQAFASLLNTLDIDAIQQIPAWSCILRKIITVFQHNWSALGVSEIIVKVCEHLPRAGPSYISDIVDAIFVVKECNSINAQRELLSLAMDFSAEGVEIPWWDQECFCTIAEKVRSSGCDVTAQAEILEQLAIAFRFLLKLPSKLKSRVYNALLCCFDFSLSKASALTLLNSLTTHRQRGSFFLPSIVYLYQTKVGGDVDSNVSCLDHVLTAFFPSGKVKLSLFVEFIAIISTGTTLAVADFTALLQILVDTKSSDDLDSLILLALKDARICHSKPDLTTLCNGVKSLLQQEMSFLSQEQRPHSTSVELENVDKSSSSNGEDPLTFTAIHKNKIQSFSPVTPLILNAMKLNPKEPWVLNQHDLRNVEEKKHMLSLKKKKETINHDVKLIMEALLYTRKQPIATDASCELLDDIVKYLDEVGEPQDDVEPGLKHRITEPDQNRTDNNLRPLSHLFGSILALNGSAQRKLCLSKNMTEALRTFDLEDREVVLLLIWHITRLILKKDSEQTEQDGSLAFLERILTIPGFLEVLKKTAVLFPAFDFQKGGNIPTMVSVASVAIGEGSSFLSLENVLQVFQMMTEDVANDELTSAFLPLLSASLECYNSSEEVLHLLRQAQNLLRKVPQESMWFIVRCLVESYKTRIEDSDINSLVQEVSRAWRRDGCLSREVGDVLQVPELLTRSFQSLSTEQERRNLVSEVFKSLHDLKRDTVTTVVACLSRERQHDQRLEWLVVQGTTETQLTVSIKASLAFCMLSKNLTFTPVEELLRCFLHLQEHLSGASPNLADFIVHCASDSCVGGLTEKERDALIMEVMKCWHEGVSNQERTEKNLRLLSDLFGRINLLKGSAQRKLCLSKKMTEALRRFDLEDREVVLLRLSDILWLIFKKDSKQTEQGGSLAFLERILTIPGFLEDLRKTTVLSPAFDCQTGWTILTMESVASVALGKGTSILSLENVLQVFQIMTEDVASDELTSAFLPLLITSLECSSSSEEVLHLLRQAQNLLRMVPQESVWFIVRCLVESYKKGRQDSDMNSLAEEVSRAWHSDGCWSREIGDVLQVPELLTRSFQSLSTEQERRNLVSEVFKNLHDLKRDTVETVVACLSRKQQHDRGLEWAVVQGKTETQLTVSIKPSLAFCMLSEKLTFTSVEELLRCLSHLQEHLSGASPNLAYFIVHCLSESCAKGLNGKDRDALVMEVMKCWHEGISIHTLCNLRLPQLVVRIFLTTKVEEERRMLTSKLLKAVTTKRQTTTHYVLSTAFSEDLLHLVMDSKLSAVEIRVCLDVCLADYALCRYYMIPISTVDAIFSRTDVSMRVDGSKEVGSDPDLPLRVAGRIALSLKSALCSEPHSEKQLEEFEKNLSEVLQLILEDSRGETHGIISCDRNDRNWGLEMYGQLVSCVEEFLIHTQDVESLIFWLRCPRCCLLKASNIGIRASQVSKNCSSKECGSNSKASFLKKVFGLLQEKHCKIGCVLGASHHQGGDLSELQVVLDAEVSYDVMEKLIDLAGDSLATAATCSKICATWPSQSECCALIEGMKMRPINNFFSLQCRFLSGLLVPLGKVLTNSSEKVQLALERLFHMWYERQTCGLERLISWREQMIAANREERVVNKWCTYFLSVNNLKVRDVDVIADLDPESMELILSGERSKRLFSEETLCREEGGELYHEEFEMFLKLARLLSEFCWMVKQIDQSTKDAETLRIVKRGCDDIFDDFIKSTSSATRGTVKKDLKTMFKSHHIILKELFVALFCRDSDNTSDLKNSELLRQDKVFHSLLCLTRRWLSNIISKPTLANVVRRVVTLLLSHTLPRSSATIHQPEKSTESLHSVSTGSNSESDSYENQSHLVDIQDYILQIKGNQMAIARLQTSGYNRCQADGERTTNTVKNLWLDSSIELRGSLHTRRAMDNAELGSMLRNLWSEWKDILKHVGVDAVSIRDQEGKTVPVDDLFSKGDDLTGMERQLMEVRRLLEGHVSERVQEGQRRLDVRERELRQKFQRQQKVEDCETKTFVVVWENRFIENLEICSEKIPGCYSPTGWHSHKPVLCSLSVDNRIIVLFEERLVTSGSKPPRDELENVEVKLLEAGMFVFDRHSCGHDVDTSELWSAFYKLLLESGAVPRIILSQKSPGYDFVTKFVRPEPIMDPVGFTFHETIVPANEDSYDFLPRVTFDSQQNRFVLSMTDDQSVFILLTKDNVKELVFKDLTEVDENNHLKLKKEQDKKNQKQRVKDVLRRVEKDLQQIHGEKTAKTLAQRLAGVVNRVISDQIEGTEESVVKEIDVDKLSKGLMGLRDRVVYARVILNAVTNFTQSTSDA